MRAGKVGLVGRLVALGAMLAVVVGAAGVAAAASSDQSGRDVIVPATDSHEWDAVPGGPSGQP